MTLILAAQLRAARAAIGVRQTDLAKAAGVDPKTIRRLEAMKGRLHANAATLRALENFFQDEGVMFTPNGVTLFDAKGTGDVAPGVYVSDERPLGPAEILFLQEALDKVGYRVSRKTGKG